MPFLLTVNAQGSPIERLGKKVVEEGLNSKTPLGLPPYNFLSVAEESVVWLCALDEFLGPFTDNNPMNIGDPRVIVYE